MSTQQTLRVAVVDDSTFIRKAIARMLDDEPMIQLVGSAASGEELLTHFEEWAPDVVTLDLDMPGMGGLETLDRVMTMRRIPVIILSTHSGHGAPMTIEALHRGATDFIDKQLYSLVDFDALRSILVEKILQVTGHPRRDDKGSVENPTSAPAPQSPPIPTTPPPPAISDIRLQPPTAYDVIAFGASTGGPPILQLILEHIGASVPVPIVVVQHMPVGFTLAFAERLNAYLSLEVSEAQAGETLLPGHVYIAPAGQHMRIRRLGRDLVTDLSDHPEGLMHKPAIDVLFESAAQHVGRRTIAALLTGMGRDGATGLSSLRHSGAHTFCQSEESCVVFGMPRAALALDAVQEIASPRLMGSRIHELLALPGPESLLVPPRR